MPSCGTSRSAVTRGASISMGWAGSGASHVTRARPGRTRCERKAPESYGVVDEHGRAGGGAQDAGARDLAPGDGVHERGLAGAGRPADDREQRRVEAAQPGQQVVVELRRAAPPARRAPASTPGTSSGRRIDATSARSSSAASSRSTGGSSSQVEAVVSAARSAAVGTPGGTSREMR